MHGEVLKELENQTIYILREAWNRHHQLALLWSMGKDSTTLLWIARKAFFGKIPFPILHIDTSYKFPEMYEFRERMTKLWNLKLLVHRNESALAEGMAPNMGSKLACCTALKTDALKQAVARFGLQALLVGIRGDEHAVRGKERIFSPRRADFTWRYQHQPPELWDLYETGCKEDWQHVRIHPLLRWRELDVWSYIQRESIPMVDLYLAEDGRRYRSIGCKTCCESVSSQARTVHDIVGELSKSYEPERAGRAQDKEDPATMQKLRALGYM